MKILIKRYGGEKKFGTAVLEHRNLLFYIYRLDAILQDCITTQNGGALHISRIGTGLSAGRS
jgi:hypothetical protein